MMPDVTDSIKLFKDQLLRMLEEYMASLPHSYLIELDGNMSPTILFEQLLERLNAYAIRRAALVQQFSPPEEEEEGEEASHEGNEMGMFCCGERFRNKLFIIDEGEEEEEESEKVVHAEEAEPVDDMDTEELMLHLAGSNVLSNKYKWQRSRWLRIDPVALKQGNRVPGRQDLAVQYVNLFLRNL
jgi:hypothetical protein